MGRILRELRALPVADAQVDAVELVAELTGAREEELNRIRGALDLRRQDALCFNLLNCRAGEWVPLRALTLVIDSTSDAPELVAKVVLSRLRAHLAKRGITIDVMRGARRLAEHVDISALAVSPAAPRGPGGSEPWGGDDDAELIRMAENGSSVAAIADELERTERAVKDRLRLHGYPLPQNLAGSGLGQLWGVLDDVFLAAVMRSGVSATVAARVLGRSERAVLERWGRIRAGYGG